jgi:hypothetical protein
MSKQSVPSCIATPGKSSPASTKCGPPKASGDKKVTTDKAKNGNF